MNILAGIFYHMIWLDLSEARNEICRFRLSQRLLNCCAHGNCCHDSCLSFLLTASYLLFFRRDSNFELASGRIVHPLFQSLAFLLDHYFSLDALFCPISDWLNTSYCLESRTKKGYWGCFQDFHCISFLFMRHGKIIAFAAFGTE